MYPSVRGDSIYDLGPRRSTSQILGIKLLHFEIFPAVSLDVAELHLVTYFAIIDLCVSYCRPE